MKDKQKQLLTEVMNEDAKDGLYKQQTAVEWFFDKLKNHEIQSEHFELYQQAKAMEKEQILNAYGDGQANGIECQTKLSNGYDCNVITSIQYYNETYNK